MTRSKIYILIVAVLIILAGSYWWFFLKIKEPNKNGEQLEIAIDLSEKTKEYKNTVRNFTLQYPESLAVKEYREEEESYTIVFADEKNEKSFQIFSTPYYGDQITEERIRKDVPDGKIREPVEVVLNDGIHALVFWSTLPQGEMREVWFLHKGYLYEVTAPSYLDEWLSVIMKSWNFN